MEFLDLDTTEEERLETAQKWWKEHGNSVITGIVLGLVFVLGWQKWQEYKLEQAGIASGIYAKLLKAVEAKNTTDIDKLATEIQTEFPKSDYAQFSALYQAQIKIQKNDLAGAKDILTKISTSTNKELSNIAKIRLARVMLATKEYEQGLKLVNDIDPASSAAFSNNYDELVGDLYVALGRLDQARTAYQNAVRNGASSPLLQMKLDDLTAPERSETKK